MIWEMIFLKKEKKKGETGKGKESQLSADGPLDLFLETFFREFQVLKDTLRRIKHLRVYLTKINLNLAAPNQKWLGCSVGGNWGQMSLYRETQKQREEII